MENRFGVKDFILFLLLLVLIGVVLLAMQQFDRQWTDVRKISSRLDDQGQAIRDIQRALARGINVRGSTSRSESSVTTSVNRSGGSTSSHRDAMYSTSWEVQKLRGTSWEASPSSSSRSHASYVRRSWLLTRSCQCDGISRW